MIVIIYLLLGYFAAAAGSITPSFLNLTIVKISLKSGKISAFYLIGGFATVLFFQANIGLYLASVLMKNSEYITLIQQIGTAILLFLALYFFKLHCTSKKPLKKQKINKSSAYFHGVGMAMLNMFAIPFYFTTVSVLIGVDYFNYSLINSLFFTIGSTAGSFTIYGLYAVVASHIEHRLTYIATKINLILGCLTGLVGVGNLIWLVFYK